MIDLKLKSLAELANKEFGENAGIVVNAGEVLQVLDLLSVAQKDAARYQWLFGARTEAEVDTYSGTVGNPLPQDFVLSEIQCFYATKAQVDASIDAAMASKS